MSQELSSLKTWIDAATALGTVAVAALAIWGEQIRAWLSPAKLVIDGGNFRGHFADLNPPRPELPPGVIMNPPPPVPPAMWYVLKVRNKRPYQKSEHCRVILIGLSRRGPDGRYHHVPFSVPRQFWWAPSESTPPEVTVVRERTIDFGFVQQGADRFVPTLYSTPFNFPGYVHRNESVRYFLQIEADNFSSSAYQVFEVSWDGQWHSDSEQMATHLTMREVFDEASPQTA
jgi:hypothetical protein